MHLLARTAAFLVLALAAAAAPADDGVVRDAILAIKPDALIRSITRSPVEDLYQVTVDGGVVYVTADGRFLINGDLVDLGTGRNYTEQARARAVGDLLALSTGRIRFGPEDAEHTLYVFTDTDCSFCRRFHNEIPELNARGIAVEYLAWPRSGAQGSTFTQMRGIWCAQDPAAAYDRVINGGRIRNATCEHPIEAHLALGVRMNVTGTPAVFDANGRRLGGYRKAAEYAEHLSD